MKKRILCIALCLCLSFIFSLSSCRQTNEFDTVAALKSAIKKDPSLEEQQVTVKGSIAKSDDGIILTDYIGDSWAGFDVKFQVEAKRHTNITIIISEDKKVMLLDSGDYVEIIGTVKISDVDIYLDECDYRIITSIYD